MLQNDLFTIQSCTQEKNNAHLIIALNPDHIIFECHFPGTPVLPGVCMMQMVKEAMETILQRNLFAQQVDYIKFLRIINPVESPFIHMQLHYTCNESSVPVNATIQSDSVTSFKFKGLLQYIS